MKFCPVVPEICHGQVHVPKKERKKERKSKLYKPVLYEYEQCMYICFSCFAYFDLLLSTNFECRL